MANKSESVSSLSLLFYLLERLFEILTVMVQMQESQHIFSYHEKHKSSDFSVMVL